MVGDAEAASNEGYSRLRGQKAEHLLLFVGEAIDEQIYEGYLAGCFSPEDLAILFRMISEWQRMGAEIVSRLVGS